MKIRTVCFFASLILILFYFTSCDQLNESEKAKEYSVYFEKNDLQATGTMQPQIVEKNGTVKLNKCLFKKSGWSFMGWAKTPKENVVYLDTANYTMGAKNDTIYAKWSVNTYSITFNKNDPEATGNTETQYLQSGSSVKLNLCGYKKKGWTFIGWAFTPIGPVVYTDDSDITMGTDNIILYAQWKINQYTLTFAGNGNTGGVVPESKKYDYKTKITLPANTGNLEMKDINGKLYNFLGWNTNPKKTGTHFTAGSGVLEITNDTTIYAEWDIYYVREKGQSGGLVFYDKGYYSDGWRYLESAPSATEWINIMWGVNGKTVGTQTAIGTGKLNTQNIINFISGKKDSAKAAELCYNLTAGGYSDWFLPSRDELQKIHMNLKMYDVGEFAGPYWSSSESGPENAWGFEMDNGVFTAGVMSQKMNISLRVRAIRAF